MIICLIVVILTDRSLVFCSYCGKLPDVPCHNNRVCTNNKFHIVSSACSLPPLLTYYLVTAHFQLCGRHSTSSILSSLMSLQIIARLLLLWSRDFEKKNCHDLNLECQQCCSHQGCLFALFNEPLKKRMNVTSHCLKRHHMPST